MRVAVLGPGGVGGLIAGVLEEAGTEVVVVARESTVALIERDGVQVHSVTFGEFVVHPRAVALLWTSSCLILLASASLGGLVASLMRPEQKTRVGCFLQAGNLAGGAFWIRSRFIRSTMRSPLRRAKSLER